MKTEIKELENSLNFLYGELKQKTTMLNKESQTSQILSPICRLPKTVLIKILLLLDFRTDISALVETCKFFNSLIASRPFQLTLYRLTTKKPDSKKEKKLQEEKTNEAELNASLSKEEILLRIYKTKKISNMFVLAFQKSEEKLKETVKNINKLNDDVIFYIASDTKTNKY